MIKHLSNFLFYTKIIFMLIAFSLTLYISLMRMDIKGLNIWSIFPLFIPLLLVLIVFVFSFFLNISRDNIFLNLVGVTVLLAIIIIDYRTIFDKNIISSNLVNLNYFDTRVDNIKIMLYLVFISNSLLMIYEKNRKIHS